MGRVVPVGNDGGDAMTQHRGRLRSLKVQGLLSFGEETTFEFGQINLLVGPNGSGKSNLLECLRIFKNCPTDVQQTFADTGFQDWVYRGSAEDARAAANLAIGLPRHDDIRHHLTLGPPTLGHAPLDESIESQVPKPGEDGPLFFFRTQGGSPVVSILDSGTQRRGLLRLDAESYRPLDSVLAQLRDAQRYPEITWLGDLYAGFRMYSESTFGRRSPLRESTPTDRSDPRLSESMDDLALVLNALQGTEAHDKIRGYLHELKESYADYITRVAFGRVGLELREAPFDRPLPAKRLSDGTLRFLALAAILLHPAPSPLICIEEPELGMHPDMIRMVANMIADAATRTQLIITTHSEHLLTALQDDFDVLFAFDVGERGSVVRPFSRDEFQEWREDHSLGSLWTAGELGGNRW